MSEPSVRAQLERILASPAFEPSKRISRFLRFVVESTLQGRGGELKEYLLGVEIFDRDEGFDPRVDPIVRVEARRLRAKLKAYYESEGRADNMIIELPTGGYVPRFRTRIPQAFADSAPPPRDIAVLPFANLSADAGNDYFSDGLAEELIHALTKVPGLRVVAWHSAAKLKDRQDDIGEIGRRLNVSAVLTGSVRIAGARLRVMARLVDTSGYCRWSEMYDRQMEDLFAIQEEISNAIVATLRLSLIGASGPQRPGNLKAYDAYLRGRFHWNKRSRAGFDRAVECFREAIAIEPGFAVGHAGLADALTLSAEYGFIEPGTVMGEAEAAALRALELDPNLAEAHASLALIRSVHQWRWVEAGQEYRRAIELNPGYATARHWYSCDYLALLGRFEEALPEAELAVRLDPLSPIIHENLAYLFMLVGRCDESVARLSEVIELDPYYYKAYSGLGRTYITMGRYTEAVLMLEKARALANNVPSLLGALGQAYALAGEPNRAREILQQLARAAEASHVAATPFALVHLGLGEKERALDWLESACEKHDPSLAALKVHPAYDPLRREPRFQAILDRVFGREAANARQ